MINFDSDKAYWEETTAKKHFFRRRKKTKQQRHEERLASLRAKKERIAQKKAFNAEIASDNKLAMHTKEYLEQSSFCLENTPPWE